MAGRLGMTGDAVVRGDKDVYKALTDKKYLVSMKNFAHKMNVPNHPTSRRRVISSARNMKVLQGEYRRGGKNLKAFELRERNKASRLWEDLNKADVTMTDAEAKRLSGIHGTQGPLPKGMERGAKMKAYEARYITAGGRKSEKWKRRADRSEVGRNVALAGATGAAGVLLATRGKRTGPIMARTRGLRKITPYRAEGAALSSAAAGGVAELYGEHARHKRASYANSPGGVAASALTRMRNYTPGG